MVIAKRTLSCFCAISKSVLLKPVATQHDKDHFVEYFSCFEVRRTLKSTILIGKCMKPDCFEVKKDEGFKSYD